MYPRLPVTTLPVVIYFNVIKNGLFGFIPCFEAAQVNKLIFQGTEKALRRGIVITIPFTAHALYKTVLTKQVLIGITGILNPPVENDGLTLWMGAHGRSPALKPGLQAL
jgi:hypothetical protein